MRVVDDDARELGEFRHFIDGEFVRCARGLAEVCVHATNGELLVVGDGGIEGEFTVQRRTAHAARLFHEFDQGGEVFLVDTTRVGLLADREVGGLTDDFTHHADGTHDANGAKGLVRDGDVAARHEEVIDVLRVEEAVREWVAVATVDGSDVLAARIDVAEGGAGDERVVRELLSILLTGVVEVDIPSGRYATIGEVLPGHDVILV